MIPQWSASGRSAPDAESTPVVSVVSVVASSPVVASVEAAAADAPSLVVAAVALGSSGAEASVKHASAGARSQGRRRRLQGSSLHQRAPPGDPDAPRAWRLRSRPCSSIRPVPSSTSSSRPVRGEQIVLRAQPAALGAHKGRLRSAAPSQDGRGGMADECSVAQQPTGGEGVFADLTETPSDAESHRGRGAQRRRDLTPAVAKRRVPPSAPRRRRRGRR